jgi:hypothetical protein
VRNGLNDAVLVNHKGYSFSEAKNRNQDAVGPRHDPLRIAQDRELQPQGPREVAVLGLAVDANRDHLSICASEFCDISLICLELAPSAARKRLHIKRQDNVPLTPIVGKPHLPSVLVLQSEIRRPISGLKLTLTESHMASF